MNKTTATVGIYTALILISVSLFGSSQSPSDSKSLRGICVAAEQGSDHEQRLVGTMYYEGIGVPQDYSEAVKWYRLAAEQGNALA